MSARRERQRGSITVELALVIVPLVILMLGMVEIAAAWKANSQISTASRQGARIASHLGVDVEADRAALRAVIAGVGGDVSRIEYVLIYDAEVNPDLGASCITVADTRCNKYTGAELAQIELDTMWGCQAGSHDDNWCPGQRDDSAASPGMIGVAIGYRHEAVSDFFGTDGMTLHERTIMRVEPGA